MHLCKSPWLIKLSYILIFCLSISSAYAQVDPNVEPNIALAFERKDAEISNSSEVLIFISFSMPETSLIQWFLQAKKMNAALVIRGLLNNSLKDTRARIKNIATQNNNSVVLDPRLFKDYQIIAVPAVVVRNTDVSTCTPAQSCWHAHPYDVVYGDVGLEYALQTIDNRGDSANAVAHRLLQQLRGNAQ